MRKTCEASGRVLRVLQEQLMNSPGSGLLTDRRETLNSHSWGARTSSASSKRKVLPSGQESHGVPPPWSQCARLQTGVASPPGISFIPRPPTPRCAGGGYGRLAPHRGPRCPTPPQGREGKALEPAGKNNNNNNNPQDAPAAAPKARS